jgi:hypothetical protein
MMHASFIPSFKFAPAEGSPYLNDLIWVICIRVYNSLTLNVRANGRSGCCQHDSSFLDHCSNLLTESAAPGPLAGRSCSRRHVTQAVALAHCHGLVPVTGRAAAAAAAVAAAAEPG